MGHNDDGLVDSLSARARRAGAAYAGPGSAGASDGARDEPRPIAFTVGLPDPALLPASELANAFAAELAADANAALQYGGAQGFRGVRDWLGAHWSTIEGVALTADNYCLANGSAGALANVCETFLDAGDVAGVETPSFPGSVRTIRSLTPRLESIAVDDEGLDVAALEARLKDLANAGARMRLLYTIPNFQNPTGSTLSLERRHRLLEVCDRHGVLIVEDDAYGELWFATPPPSSLYALAGGDGVIKIGTFSKIVAPGLRAGWAQAKPAVVAALVATRCDMGISPLVLRGLDRLATEGFLDTHIARGRAVYAEKCAAVLERLEATCRGLATWVVPEGGFFVWLTVDDAVDPPLLVEAAAREGVTFASGLTFFSEQTIGEGPRVAWAPGDSRYIRLAFSAVPLDQIGEGIDRLGRALAAARRA